MSTDADLAKAFVVITDCNDEYVEFDLFEAVAENTDPINDNGKTAPKPANPAPPAVPFPATVPPSSSTPPDVPTGDVPAPKSQGPDTDDDLNDEYVGGRKVDPAKLPNPEGGGLAPNPDNADTIPKGGTPDSFDDDSAKPDPQDGPWFMGSLRLVTEPLTGLAKWPLEFGKIEKDTKRPNKPSNPRQEPKNRDSQDAVKVAKQEQPFGL